MSSLHVPRPALSLPVNETAQLPPKQPPRDPSKTFSRIISHLKFEHDNSSQKLQVPKSSSTRPFSNQSCDVQMFLAESPRVKTPRASIREDSKINSTIMSHCALPASDPTSCESTPRVSYIDPAVKPTPKVKNSKQALLNNPPGSEHIVHPTAQTRYIDMLLGLDEVPRSHNLLAAFSTWILLAGFIVVPGTFVSIEHSKTLQQGAKNSKVAHAFLDTVKHASLIFVASLCCGMGSAGMVWLWWRWRHNYVWLINKIFL